MGILQSFFGDNAGAGDKLKFFFAMVNPVDLVELHLIDYKTPRVCYKYYNLYKKCAGRDGIQDLCLIYKKMLVNFCDAEDETSLKVSDHILENCKKSRYQVSDDMFNEHKILLERVQENEREENYRGLKLTRQKYRRHCRWCTVLSSHLFEEGPESPDYEMLKRWWDEDCKKRKKIN